MDEWAHREEPGVGGVVDGDGGNGDAARHLHDGEETVVARQHRRLDRYPNHLMFVRFGFVGVVSALGSRDSCTSIE